MLDVIFVSVILYANTAALTGIAILLNVICLRMGREERLSNPPRLLKLIFKGVVVKALALSNYEVTIYKGKGIIKRLSLIHI